MAGILSHSLPPLEALNLRLIKAKREEILAIAARERIEQQIRDIEALKAQAPGTYAAMFPWSLSFHDAP